MPPFSFGSGQPKGYPAPKLRCGSGEPEAYPAPKLRCGTRECLKGVRIAIMMSVRSNKILVDAIG